MPKANETTRLNLATPVFTSHRAEVTGRMDEDAMETHTLYAGHDIDEVDRLYIQHESIGGE